jgi:hypothetical protein
MRAQWTFRSVVKLMKVIELDSEVMKTLNDNLGMLDSDST